MSAWAYLPNAPHIDRVLKHMTENPARWDAAWDAAWNAAWNAAWETAWEAAWETAWNANRGDAWNAAWEAARNTAEDAARDAARNASWGAVSALVALVAWDDCAHLLDLTPEAVKGIVRISNSKAAVLLLPAVIALHLEGA